MERTRLLWTVTGLVVGVMGGLAWRSYGQSCREIDLLAAALEGTPAEVRACLEAGAGVDAADPKSGFTPLHFAAFRGDGAIARLLVDRGADTNARSRNGGYTPLHIAAMQGHVGVVRVLLEHGARRDTRSGDGKTPVDVARQFRRIQVQGLFSGEP